MSKSNFESYPPLFRPSNPTQKPEPSDELINKSDSIYGVGLLPIIDMECFHMEKLDKVCREWGIFRLVNHGIPTSLLRSLEEYARELFDLPYETKQDLVSNCPINYFWGTPALTQEGAALQRANSPQNLDWMEGLNVPFSQLHNHHPLIDDHQLISDFRNLFRDYRVNVTKLATKLFEAMIKSLNIDTKVATTYLDESTGLVRVYRYPRHCIEDDVKGLHGHTDSSVLSILSEDEVGGLQFVKDDQWIHVKPIPGTLVVNLGDMMQAMSDDKYKSVKHKVELNKQKERISICYFVFPEENTMIQSSIYKPFTYNDFRAQVQQDLKTVGRKIGLQSFKLPLVQ